MASFLSDAKFRLQHNSKVSLAPKDIKNLAEVISTEKNVINSCSKLSVDMRKSAEAMKEWGLGEGDDLADVLPKLSILFGHLADAQLRFSDYDTTYRMHFKSIRMREENLTALKKAKENLNGKIAALEKKITKMSSENKDLPSATSKLQELRSELIGIERSVTLEDSRLWEFKRETVRESFGLRLGAMLELAEKMTIICELGKMIVDEVPIDRSSPGGMRSPYTSAVRTQSILEEAQRSLTEVIFNPSSSSTGNNRMKANPESVPPSPPNSSDLAPPNRLGLHPDQQSSSGLATELPPLYFRSNVDDSSKVESNSDPNQYRARDEDLPRADLIASTSSLPYAMDASDTQSTAENLTMFSSSHPRSENTDYMPSVERLSTAASSSAYTALEPPSRYHAKSHDEFYVRRPDGVPISAGTVNKSSFYNSNNSNDVHHSEYEFNPHDNQHKSPELHESQSAAFPSTNAAEARNSIANIGLAYRSPDNRNSLLNMNNSGYSSMNEGKTTNAGAFRKHNLGGVAAAATGSLHSASPTENLQNRMAGVSLSDDYEGDSKRGSIAPLNIHKHPHSPPNYLQKQNSDMSLVESSSNSTGKTTTVNNSNSSNGPRNGGFGQNRYVTNLE